MKIRSVVVGLCAAAIAAMTLAPADVAAEPKKRQYVYTRERVSKPNRPRSRIVVLPRSFLDAGTEVAPGERKFTDYAFPPGYRGATGVVTNTGGRVGWDVSPFTQPPYLGGFNPW